MEDYADCVNYYTSNVTNQASCNKYLELKAEIEKLKAAQRSRQNIDPERYRLCRQEITSLRMKLHQQERDMVEMQRWATPNTLPVLLGTLGPARQGWGGAGAGREEGSKRTPPISPPSSPAVEQPTPRLSDLFLSGLIIVIDCLNSQSYIFAYF